MILHYQKGFRGVVRGIDRIQTPIFPKQDVTFEHITLTKDGILSVEEYYPTDFASGPTIDWPKYILPLAVIHDAFCDLHKQGLITERERKRADLFLKESLRFNSSWIWYPRWEYWYRGVRLEAGTEHSPKPIHSVEFKVP